MLHVQLRILRKQIVYVPNFLPWLLFWKMEHRGPRGNMKKINKDTQIIMLKAENDALKSIIALAPGNIYWRGIDGKYLGCNISQAHALGLKTPDEIIGKVAGQIADAD